MKIDELRAENQSIKKILFNLVTAFNNYEFAVSEQEQQNTWETLRDLMHEELLKIENGTKVLKDENKKNRGLIKQIVVENFSCSYCKELGFFSDCEARKNTCEQLVSEWFDEVMEQSK